MEKTLKKYGNIDWDTLANKLAKCNNVNLDYELLMYKKQNETPEQTLEACLIQANELENKLISLR